MGAGRLVVSLEPWQSQRLKSSGGWPDAELTVGAPPGTVELKVHSGEGGDVLDGRGLDRHRGLIRSVLLAGDAGKDTLLGTERSDQSARRLRPDRLYGRGGRDSLYPSAGKDSTSGGPAGAAHPILTSSQTATTAAPATTTSTPGSAAATRSTPEAGTTKP